MEFGKVSRMHSKFLNDTLIVYNSERKPGYAYCFNLQRGNNYRCCRCRELGKERTISVVNETVVGRKHPEDDHHPDCEPLDSAALHAQQHDRLMRSEVSLWYNTLFNNTEINHC